jgi:K+-sensing histidine kinase KdpD
MRRPASPARDRIRFLTVSTDIKSSADKTVGNHQRAASRIQRVVGLCTSPVAQALLFVGIATGVSVLVDAVLPVDLGPIIYLIPVVVAATRWGFVPALVAALASAAAGDFFLTTPYYSFWMNNPQEIFDLLLFLFVAVVSSNLAAQVRREADALRRSKQHIHELYELSRQLALCFTVRDLVIAVHNYVSTTLGQRAAFIAAPDDNDVGSLDDAVIPDDVRREAHAMIGRDDQLPRRWRDETTQTSWLLKAVSSETANHGVIAVNIEDSAGTSTERTVERIEAIMGEAALVLERIDVGHAMHEARLRLQADLLKDALHGIVSHELRTPLASIVGAASVLSMTPAMRDNHTMQSLLDGIHDEASDLDGFLQNLINASRVTADGVRPRLEWADPADIINAAIERRGRRLARHQLQLQLEDDLPLVRADSVLVEEACGQLLDNAAKYAPAGSTIAVVVRAEHDRVAFSILDEGCGLTTEERRQLGRKSFRGQRHRDVTPGFGLGLWIALAFAKANGGSIEITARGQRPGTIASVFLPVASPTSTTAVGDA